MLDAESDHDPADADIAHRLGMSVARYDHLCRLSQLGKEVHFSAMEPATDQSSRGPSRVWDIGDDRCNDPALSVSRSMLTEYISKGLTREERLVLTLYYFEELTMAEIGLVLNLSESRVSQIHKDILQRLRQRFGSTLVEELVA
jgi:RNA polymerase sigma factor for flagellar operon FliA